MLALTVIPSFAMKRSSPMALAALALARVAQAGDYPCNNYEVNVSVQPVVEICCDKTTTYMKVQ